MHIPLIKRKLHILYIALALASLLLGGIAHVRAEEPAVDIAEPTLTPPLPPVRTDTRSPELSGEQRDRFINLVRNVYGKMDAAILRLTDIATRLEARIEILKNQGVDTSRASVPLSDAQKKLEESRARLAQVKVEAETALDGDTPLRSFPPIRSEFREIRNTIRDAFILIRESLAELKDATLVLELNRRNVGAVPEATPLNQ